METAIKVEGLSKRYKLGHAAHETMLRERLVRVARSAFGRERRKEDILWALRGVSFSVRPGEVIGIIGHNGSGKSTLLKILSRITWPSAGAVNVNGRVASLLEVGTGFHEELTGMENIFLNGSILGMSKKEVERKLEAIVEFSGVARFLDTPIKRYSSGMRLRLGFAVAAHLDPDILIVDEVLAVGDAAFQKKCLSAMEDMRGGHRTVLFVSHNLAAVENLCSRCIWLDTGEVRMDGPSRDVIKQYLSAVTGVEKLGTDLEHVEERRGTGDARYVGVEFRSPDGALQNLIRAGDPLTIRLQYRVHRRVPYPSFGFRLYTDMGTMVTDTSTWHHGIDIPALEPGDGHLDLDIDQLNLMPGRYNMMVFITGLNSTLHDTVECGIPLEVEQANIYGSGKQLDSRYGFVFFPQTWRMEGIGDGAVRAAVGALTSANADA